jgi:arylformamidase
MDEGCVYMKIIDISMPISPKMMVYKNKPQKKPQFNLLSTHQKKDIHETEIKLSLHTGTHVDAPLHAIKNGETMETYPLDNFYGNALVIDLTSRSEMIEVINQEILMQNDIQENDIVLFKTKNSNESEFNFNFTYLSASGALYLVNKKIKAVGTDGLGIERNQAEHTTHKLLLEKKIPIIEGLRLAHVIEGRYQFIGFPISISQVEASLLRAVLIL